MRSTITDTGRTLLSRLELGQITMQFCEIRTGSGVYSPSEIITLATGLKVEKNSYPISSSEETRTGFMLTAGISNVNSEGQSVVDEAYRVNEIGVFVEVDGTKYLYMIAVQDGDTGNVLPAYNGNNAIDFVEKFALTISNTANVTINMSGAYALSEDVQRWIGQAVSDHAALPTHLSASERIRWNGEEECETVFNEDGSIEETTEAGTKVTEFNPDGSITETYPGGRILTTYFNQDGSISRVLGAWEPQNSPEPPEETTEPTESDVSETGSPTVPEEPLEPTENNNVTGEEGQS